MLYLEEWLSIGFVLVGLVLLAFAYYLRHKAENLRKTLTQLYELNQSVNQDALDFFEQAWPILEQAGLVTINANIYWFGETQNKTYSSNRKSAFKRSYQIDVDDMSFKLVVVYPKSAVEENSWLTLIVSSFVQILQQDLEHKRSEILTSQKRLERYQLFVQHEIKNIAQFIQLLSEQVVQLEQDSDKLKLINRLQTSLPIMSERAKNTLQKMQQPLHEFFVSDAVSLHSILFEILAMFELDADLEGDANVFIARPLLMEAFKNIFGNYRDHKNDNHNLKVKVEERESGSAKVVIESQFDSNAIKIQVERMFEPFWTSSESGLGLGLFLTRELLNQVNGDIHFSQHGNTMQFEIELQNTPNI